MVTQRPDTRTSTMWWSQWMAGSMCASHSSLTCLLYLVLSTTVPALHWSTSLTKCQCMQTEWQVRICYYHYQKMRRQFPDSAMGGFTRLLHRCMHVFSCCLSSDVAWNAHACSPQ